MPRTLREAAQLARLILIMILVMVACYVAERLPKRVTA